MTRVISALPPAETLAQGAHLPDLYASDATHGWSIGMRAISRALLDTCVIPPGPVLEVGCGGGFFLRELSDALPQTTVLGSDIHPLSLAFARWAAPDSPLMQADMNHLPLPENAVASIVGLDALDQVGVEAATAMQEFARVLVPGGVLLLRVSAYPWLLGPHDHAFNTLHRYTVGELYELCQAGGFSVLRHTYANSIFGVPAILPRLLQRWGMMQFDTHAASSNSLMRFLFVQGLNLEAAWLRKRRLPAGLSLYVLAEKRSHLATAPDPAGSHAGRSAYPVQAP